MNKPVRTTLVFGLLSALVTALVLWLQRFHSAYSSWPLALELAVWFNLAGYAMLLCRWSRTRISALVFPLALLLGVALWPGTLPGFLLMALGVFSWIRSGICFRNTPMRALAAELLTVLGGCILITFWWPQAILAWALAVWLFFLVQSVYFFIIPATRHTRARLENPDPFEQAFREAQRLLEGN